MLWLMQLIFNIHARNNELKVIKNISWIPYRDAISGELCWPTARVVYKGGQVFTSSPIWPTLKQKG